MLLETALNVSYPVRALFYGLTFKETTFEKVEDVPNIVVPAIPVFFTMVLLELAIASIKDYDIYSVSDSVTSIGAGLFSRLPDLFLRTIEMKMYIYVYENYRIYELPLYSPWTWILAMLGVDCAYYWFHRFSHELNFIWAFHQTHHSSEYYNLSTALRQSAIQKYASAVFYVPLVLFVTPSMALIHFQLNLLYQFWIHTELVGNLGPLEWILNTASHHRVHHGRNPYAIDKNYAGVFIIWDRMFGTFEPERIDEPLAYGLVHNINTFDAFAIQFNHFGDVYKKLRIVWRSKRNVGLTRVVNFAKALFWGPGWFPSKPNLRLGDIADLPKIDKSKVVRHGKPLPKWLSFYVIVQLLISSFILTQSTELLRQMVLNLQVRMIGLEIAIGLVASLGCIGFICDQRRWCYIADATRSFVFVGYGLSKFGKDLSISADVITFLHVFYSISLVVMLGKVGSQMVNSFQDQNSGQKKIE